MAHLLDDPLPEGIYGPTERLVVEYSQRLTRLDPIDADLYARLAAVFPPAGLVELCLIVGTAALVNRFHATFHTDNDAPFMAALAAGSPLPLPQPRGV